MTDSRSVCYADWDGNRAGDRQSVFVAHVYPGFVAGVCSERLISEESAQEGSPDVKGMLAAQMELERLDEN